MSRKQYRSRFEKRKQNRTLNIAIGVVILLIIVVGANIFMNGGSSQTSSTPAQSDQDKKDKSSSSKTDSKKKEDSIVVEEDKNKDSSDQDQSTSSPTNDSEDKNNDAADKKEADKSKADQPEGGGPDGPWEPVGTSQTGSHTKSYDKGTADWNEQTKALSYATGIPADQMTILWLGNGGAPDQSVGRVLSKKDGSRYEVQLKWEDGKGWKPTSVTKN
ncbi:MULTISPECIES: YrrS family protein [Fictibacillus]|uniref:YrrS family protein n=1 Tax=Fictibacillus terranigra TaxID=3058424 RepID=A0ABT8E4F7_9BACL|nr:YrrS family protein [Fictibacillus sp. CENA-BCM004]MDN4072790.1 YrrS family protein [Fictibacillus sp. CENA-BCM004]